jgi:uridine kinase
MNTVYSPHVLVLEGIFALHDQRVLDMLDLKVMHGFADMLDIFNDLQIFAEAEADLCLSRRR